MNLGIALNFLSSILANAGTLSGLIQKANAEGRTELSEAEWAHIIANRDAAIASLDAHIAAAKAPPPSPQPETPA